MTLTKSTSLLHFNFEYKKLIDKLQYWPIYYGFFWKKIKTSQKLNDTSKKVFRVW